MHKKIKQPLQPQPITKSAPPNSTPSEFPTEKSSSCVCEGNCPRCNRDIEEALPNESQQLFENSFHQDFSQVRIHRPRNFSQLAYKPQVKAFASGNDITFSDNHFQPHTKDGQHLLAHELTHIIQQKNNFSGDGEKQANCVANAFTKGIPIQPLLGNQKNNGHQASNQIQYYSGSEAEHSTDYDIDYDKAKEENLLNQNDLGWGSMLGVTKKGLFSAWEELWFGGKYNEFADAVAQYQWVHSLPTTGIIDAATWGKMADLNSAMAGIVRTDDTVANEHDLDPEGVCTDATEARIRESARLIGMDLEMPEGKTSNMFEYILHTSLDHLADIPKEYRGTGAAGAFVYADLGRYVTENEIWAGALQPGAVVQVWNKASDFTLLQEGKVESKDDLSSYGTSFVFVRYMNNGTEMTIRHYNGTEYKQQSSYEFWLAANPNF